MSFHIFRLGLSAAKRSFGSHLLCSSLMHAWGNSVYQLGLENDPDGAERMHG
jgi:hypothetical protein